MSSSPNRGDAPTGQTAAPKETQRRRRTRERLMDAGYKLFSENGVHGTSIEAIAEAAGFTRGAFYSNFASKTELFFALANREWDIRLSRLQKVLDEKAQPGAGSAAVDSQFIGSLITEVFATLPDDRKWGLIYREFELLALRDEQVAPEFLANYNTFLQALADVISQSAQHMGVRFTLPAPAITQIVMLQYESAMRAVMLSGQKDQEAAMRAEMLRTIPALVQQLIEDVE